MMRIYSIFDDFEPEAVRILQEAGIDVTVHPLGIPRPTETQMRNILEVYDGVVIGTSQSITEEMFERITTPRWIGTASVGVDHIHVPEEKRRLIKVYNTPKANSQSVAEYTFGCALTCCKRLVEGSHLYLKGKDNKKLKKKPEDLAGKTLGVVGAGNISKKIMEYGSIIGMNTICWTKHPEKHKELVGKTRFVSLSELAILSDVISVNLPNNEDTKGIISDSFVDKLNNDSIFISVSRLDVVDYRALFTKAQKNSNFYVCMDVDLDEKVLNTIPEIDNVMITPHIAGGTIETRRRMFIEVAKQLAESLQN